MFDLIKFVVDKILPSIPWKLVTEKQRDRRLADIGKQLFLFYLALNRLCANGEALVAELEGAVRYIDYKGDALRDVIVDDLYYLVVAQGQAVVDLAASAYDLAAGLELVAPDAFDQIAPLIEGKASALQQLAVALSGSYSGWVGQATPELLPAEYDFRRSSGFLTDDYRAKLQDELKRTYELVVALRGQSGVLHVDQVDLLRAFLDTGHAHDRLEHLRSAAKLLRSGIVDHFSVDDLLLEVGDTRLAAGKPFNVLGNRRHLGGGT